MRRGLDYLRGMVNGTVGLLRASGSLFIDVFDRHGTHATFRTPEIVFLFGYVERFDRKSVASVVSAAGKDKWTSSLRTHTQQ